MHYAFNKTNLLCYGYTILSKVSVFNAFCWFSFEKKYAYLSVKMNWNQYVAKILRFLLSLVPSLSQEDFTRTKTRSYGDLYWENLISYQSDHLALFRWPLWRKRDRWSDWHHLSIRKFSGVLPQFFNIIIWVLFPCRLQCKIPVVFLFFVLY